MNADQSGARMNTDERAGRSGSHAIPWPSITVLSTYPRLLFERLKLIVTKHRRSVVTFCVTGLFGRRKVIEGCSRRGESFAGREAVDVGGATLTSTSCDRHSLCQFSCSSPLSDCSLGSQSS